jgi:hypothetical protein
MRHLIVPALTVSLAVFGVAGSALADMAPPDGYVETCTVEQQQGAGETCVDCAVDYTDFDACANTYEPQGYTKSCQTWGASVYTEVFCKAVEDGGSGGSAGSGATTATGGAASAGGPPSGGATATGGTPAPTAEPPSSSKSDDGGCSIAGRATGVGALWLTLVGLALGLRRRR